MPTKPSTATKASSSQTGARRARSTKSDTPDAIKLLTADHREVKAMFQEYQSLVDHEALEDERQALAEAICDALTIHATLEEEIFYPEAKSVIKEPELIGEATVEHASAKDLIAQIREADPGDELYDAKVKVLGEYIDHHVKEEESELFPQCRRGKLDLDALGERLAARKAELLQEVASEDASAIH